jgi:hypothetical protein
VPVAVRAMHAVPTGARGHPARDRHPVGVLPGGVALQVRQQALHAVNGAAPTGSPIKAVRRDALQLAGGRACTDHAMRVSGIVLEMV